MMTIRIHSKIYFLLFLPLVTGMLSSCLTRKNALPPERAASASHRKPAKGTILTDASASPRDVRTTENALLDGYATVLGVSIHELQNPALYAYIDEWMGTPHRSGGTGREGLDCSAFVGMVMREVYDKPIPRISKEMAEQVKRKYERQLKEGDLVFFSFGRRQIDHVGIYLHNHKFVHVSTSKGIIISDIRDAWYSKYFVRAGSVL